MNRPRHASQQDIQEQKATVLTQAAVEAARVLGLSPADTAAVLGVAGGAFAAMKKGERTVDSSNGEAERADALVRVVKSLTKLLGGSETNWRAWLRRDVGALSGKPLSVMQQRDGVLKVAQYLAQNPALTPEA